MAGIADILFGGGDNSQQTPTTEDLLKNLDPKALNSMVASLQAQAQPAAQPDYQQKIRELLVNRPPAVANDGNPVSTFVGNRFGANDPNITNEYAAARQGIGDQGYWAGLFSGYSPIPGKSLGSALTGELAAQNSLVDQGLKATQAQNQITDAEFKRLQSAGLVQSLQSGQLGIDFQKQHPNILGDTTGPGGTGGPATGAKPPAGSSTIPTDGSQMSTHLGMVRQYESNNNYNAGYSPNKPVDLSTAPLDDTGFPIWKGNMGSAGISHAAGAYQIQPGTWRPIAKTLGIKDFSPASQDAVAAVLYKQQGLSPWAPFNPKLRAALAAQSAQPAAAAPNAPAAAAPAAPAAPVRIAAAQPQGIPEQLTTPQPAPAATPAVPSPMPPRIGMSGSGPNAQMVDMDTGKPFNPSSPQPTAPGGPAPAAEPAPSVQTAQAATQPQPPSPPVSAPAQSQAAPQSSEFIQTPYGTVTPQQYNLLRQKAQLSTMPGSVIKLTPEETEVLKLPYDVWQKQQEAIATAKATNMNNPRGLSPGQTGVVQGVPTTLPPAPRDNPYIDPATNKEKVWFGDPLKFQQWADQGFPGRAPGQAGAAGEPGTTKSLSPDQKKELEARGDTLAKFYETTNAAADAAKTQQANLLAMRNDAPNIYTGPGAQTLLGFQKIMRLVDPSYDQPVAGSESFIKNGGTLVRSAVRQESTKAAVQEFKLITDQLPGLTTSPKGLQETLGEYMGFNDYNIAKATAMNQWIADPTHHNSVAGFEADWHHNVDPHTFIVRRMEPSMQAELLKNLNTTKEGQAALQALKKQDQYIRANNLEPAF